MCGMTNIVNLLLDYNKNPENKEIQLVNNGKSYFLRVVNLTPFSTNRFVRFFQIIARAFHAWQNRNDQEKVESKAFTAAVIYAMTLRCAKLKKDIDIPDLDARVKEAARSCLYGIVGQDLNDMVSKLETLRGAFQQQYGDKLSQPLFKKAVVDEVVVTPRDGTTLENIYNDMARIHTPLLFENNIKLNSNDNSVDNLEKTLIKLVTHLGEADKYVPAYSKAKKKLKEPLTKQQCFNLFLQNINIEDSRLIKLLRLCSQSVPNSLCYNVLVPLLYKLGDANWRSDFDFKNPIIQLLPQGNVSITFKGEIKAEKDGCPNDWYQCKFKIAIECGPDMVISPDKCQAIISDLKISKHLPTQEAERVCFALQPFFAKKADSAYFALQPFYDSAATLWKWDDEPKTDLHGVNVIDRENDFDKVKCDAVRTATIKKLIADFEVPGPHFMTAFTTVPSLVPKLYMDAAKQVRLYKSSASLGSKPTRELLGRFDVLQMPCRLRFDGNGDEYSEVQNMFLVHEAAAINFDDNAEFLRYSTKGKLDEDRYVKDMQKIMGNLLSAQNDRVKHAVWGSFDMDEFLRTLPLKDKSYNQVKLFRLRQRLADAFIEELEKLPELQVHLCLPTSGKQTYNAFMKAIYESSDKIQARVTVYKNGDAADVAQSLAAENGHYSVSLANCAHRNLLGDGWYKIKTSVITQDEKLRMRSHILAGVSLLLNDGAKEKQRSPEFLSDQVKRYSGKVKTVDNSE